MFQVFAFKHIYLSCWTKRCSTMPIDCCLQSAKLYANNSLVFRHVSLARTNIFFDIFRQRTYNGIFHLQAYNISLYFIANHIQSFKEISSNKQIYITRFNATF